MNFLLAQGVTSSRGSAYDFSWEEFCQVVKDSSEARANESKAEKRLAPWFSGTKYENDVRRRENMRSLVHVIVADLDEVRDPAGVEKAIARWEYIAWTTWSSTPEQPRWRVVIPIEGGVSPQAFTPLARRVLSPLERFAKIDSRSYLPEQLWFFPWYKRSMASHHVVWTNSGAWVKDTQLISVDFTGVKLVSKPREIEKGERNNSLVIRLSEPDALRCETRADLLALAFAWNESLAEPMPKREVRDIVRKKWAWLQRGEGVLRRAEAFRSGEIEWDLPEIGSGLASEGIAGAKIPDSLVGDFLYPGATMLTAKMKEGKSFLTMQMALAIATGTPFLKSGKFPGFAVRTRTKCVVIAGEDTLGGIKMRFHGSMEAGHLPRPDSPEDVIVIVNDDLDSLRAAAPKNIPGALVFEKLVEQWYRRGYRVIFVDPLRVLEGALRITSYPGAEASRNAHVQDFQTMRFYTRIAQKYPDLHIVISMHHGKNKRDHNASDPGDMIAGTTGFGAGAVATISLLPVDERLESSDGTKRRELYLHGRHTREQRILIEQSNSTGIWSALGHVESEVGSIARRQYFEAILDLGGAEQWVSADAIARRVGKTSKATVIKVLARARRENATHDGWKLVIKRGVGGGYRLKE